MLLSWYYTQEKQWFCYIFIIGIALKSSHYKRNSVDVIINFTIKSVEMATNNSTQN